MKYLDGYKIKIISIAICDVAYYVCIYFGWVFQLLTAIATVQINTEIIKFLDCY